MLCFVPCQGENNGILKILMKMFFHFSTVLRNPKISAVFITSVTAFLLVLDLAFTRCYHSYGVSPLN